LKGNDGWLVGIKGVAGVEFLSGLEMGFEEVLTLKEFL